MRILSFTWLLIHVGLWQVTTVSWIAFVLSAVCVVPFWSGLRSRFRSGKFGQFMTAVGLLF